MEVLEAAYKGDTAMIIDGKEYDARGYAKNGVITNVCRQLIADGYAPERIIIAKRNGTTCFTPQPISFWASKTIHENDNDCCRMRKFVADPRAKKGAETPFA